MDKKLRLKAVKAMDFLAHMLNNEELFIDMWLTEGVADGDIESGDLEVTAEDEDNLGGYIEDDNFRDLMWVFLRSMSAACTDGGLYCDGVIDAGGDE